MSLSQTGNVGHAARETVGEVEGWVGVDFAVEHAAWLDGEVVVAVEEGRGLEDSGDSGVERDGFGAAHFRLCFCSLLLCFSFRWWREGEGIALFCFVLFCFSFFFSWSSSTAIEI